MWVVLVSGLIVTLGFAERQEAKQLCKDLVVSIKQDDNAFIDEQDIRQMLIDKGDSIKGQPIASVNVNKIERLVNTNPWVKKAEAYLDIDGILQIDVEQRTPLVRIINTTGESYYLDTEGNLMLWSPKYTPRILVATGNIHEAFNVWYKTGVPGIMSSDTLAKVSMLDDVYAMAKYVTANPFWDAQVGAININRNNDIELVPSVGDHTIIFGGIEEMPEKFAKLKLFYSEGLNHTNWNIYDTLNLKYKDQVVCTKIKSLGH